MKKIFGFGAKERTPLGFCDGRRASQGPGHGGADSRYWHRFYAKRKTDAKIHRAASAGRVEEVKALLSSGKWGVDARDKKNRTALHFACAHGHLEVVTLLVESKCEIDICDSDNSTALIKAVQCQQEECASFLLKHGADPDIKDTNGNTALHYAVYNGNTPMATKLLSYNANIEEQTQDHLTPLLLALRENKLHLADYFIWKGANIHTFDDYKRNTLMYAVRCDSRDIVQLLLRKGVDVSFRDDFGWTAFRYAVEGHCKVGRIILDYKEKLLNSIQNSNPANNSCEDNALARLSDESGTVASSPIIKDDVNNFNTKKISESLPKKNVDQEPVASDQAGEPTEKVQVEGIVTSEKCPF